jgi:hypothetical protein
MGVDSYISVQVAETMVLPPPRVPMHFASDYILPRRSIGNRLAPEDLCGLTLLIFSHVYSYGTFKLDMEACIPLEADEASEVPLKGHLEL